MDFIIYVSDSEVHHRSKTGPSTLTPAPLTRAWMTTNEPELSVEESTKANVPKLLAKCEELVERFEYELALKFCERILSSEPQNIDTLQMKATILIDMGEVDAAKQVLQSAADAEPDSGPEKYIALAQLSEGEEALDYFQLAAKLLTAIKINEGDAEALQIQKKQMASIYCSMAELYLTDLCLQEDAEALCEKYIEEALKAHPEDYEALQTLCNMRLSQDKAEEAAEALSRSITTWSAIPYEDLEYPSFEFRLICSRLLVELGSCDLAQQILEALSHEDDEIIEVWYLLALALFSQEKLSFANEALLNAERMISEDVAAELTDAIAELREAIGVPDAVEDGKADESMESCSEDAEMDQ